MRSLMIFSRSSDPAHRDTGLYPLYARNPHVREYTCAREPAIADIELLHGPRSFCAHITTGHGDELMQRDIREPIDIERSSSLQGHTSTGTGQIMMRRSCMFRRMRNARCLRTLVDKLEGLPLSVCVGSISSLRISGC